MGRRAFLGVVVALLWKFMYSADRGLINQLLETASFGLIKPIDWLGDPATALPAVMIMSMWQAVGFHMVIWLAGLQSIPKSLIEAAAIDGAGPARRFWTIVFPLLSPTTFFLLVVNIVYAFFDTFGVIDATTQGGPAQATQILVYKVYHDGVKAADLGGSSAQSVILMFIVIALTVVQFRFIERKVQY